MADVRLIDANELTDTIEHIDWYHISLQGTLAKGAISQLHTPLYKADDIYRAIENAPTVNAVAPPCKIGDYVWAIRNRNGTIQPERGVVSEMYFTSDMQLRIVVKYIARGEWGKTVFATDKEAYAAIAERKTKNETESNA